MRSFLNLETLIFIRLFIITHGLAYSISYAIIISLHLLLADYLYNIDWEVGGGGGMGNFGGMFVFD